MDRREVFVLRTQVARGISYSLSGNSDFRPLGVWRSADLCRALWCAVYHVGESRSRSVRRMAERPVFR